MAAKDKKFYYLKLFDDFFERDEIKIIEDMTNGKEYVLFYLKLLCKSVKMVGMLRVNELIPYDAQMLASLTKTNVDIVKGACDVFVAFGLMSIYDNGTIYMEQIEKMMGTESYWAERKRVQRAETQKNEQLPEPLDIVQQASNECPHILDIDIDKEKEIDTTRTSALETEFEELWKLYPRKKDKAKAKKAYVSARKKGTSFEEVEAGIKAYNAEIANKGTVTQYIKHGGVWFNGHCWEDDYDIGGKGNEGNTGHGEKPHREYHSDDDLDFGWH